MNRLFAIDTGAAKSTLDKVLSVIGRLAIAGLFVDAARYHVTSGWEKTLTDMHARGIPMTIPLLIIAMIASTGLALALLINYCAKWAALLLAIYTMTVSLVMYHPWSSTQLELIFFLKDLAIFGGLLALSAALD